MALIGICWHTGCNRNGFWSFLSKRHLVASGINMLKIRGYRNSTAGTGQRRPDTQNEVTPCFALPLHHPRPFRQLAICTIRVTTLCACRKS